MQTLHRQKIRTEYFHAVMTRKKNFEIIKDDGILKMKEGDIIVLQEWNRKKGYTGRECRRKVKYVLRDCPEYGLKSAYCIVSW